MLRQKEKDSGAIKPQMSTPAVWAERADKNADVWTSQARSEGQRCTEVRKIWAMNFKLYSGNTGVLLRSHYVSLLSWNTLHFSTTKNTDKHAASKSTSIILKISVWESINTSPNFKWVTQRVTLGDDINNINCQGFSEQVQIEEYSQWTTQSDLPQTAA